MKPTIMTILVFSTKLLFGQVFEQTRTSTDFYTQIKNHDLSVVWMADSIFANEEEMIKRPQVLGFIGDDFQRFHIRFTSITQNPLNPYEYFAYGKTKVKGSIRPFQGTIKITKARLYKEVDIQADGDVLPNHKQGFVVSEVTLFQDRQEESTGFFSGKSRSGFLIDDKGVFRYDAISFFDADFSNNDFVGTWTCYRTKLVKRVHWGDWRIPESGDLDIGSGEFSVNERYVENGWESYMNSWLLPYDNPEGRKARERERRQWWK